MGAPTPSTGALGKEFLPRVALVTDPPHPSPGRVVVGRVRVDLLDWFHRRPINHRVCLARPYRSGPHSGLPDLDGDRGLREVGTRLLGATKCFGPLGAGGGVPAGPCLRNYARAHPVAAADVLALDASLGSLGYPRQRRRSSSESAVRGRSAAAHRRLTRPKRLPATATIRPKTAI